MKSPTLILSAALLAAFVITGSAVAGGPFTSTQSGAWDLGVTWGNIGNTEGTHFPGTGDTATISAGHTVDVDSTAARLVANLTIEDAACASTPGILEIKADSKLTIETSLDMEHALQTPGRIIFTGDSGTNAGILFVSADMNAAGVIRVEDLFGGKIEMDAQTDDLTITPTGRVYAPDGKLTIAGSIINNGRITANGKDSGFDIEFTEEGPEATSCGLFEVVRCDALMHFNMTSAQTFTGLANFNSEAGTMRFTKDVTTVDSALGGGLRVVLGTVQVDVDISVDFQGVYTGW